MASNSNSALSELLHALVALGIGAASIFVKNPESRKQAAQIIDLTSSTVLPLADSLLNSTNETPVNNSGDGPRPVTP